LLYIYYLFNIKIGKEVYLKGDEAKKIKHVQIKINDNGRCRGFVNRL
jgi:outer membrane protein assembly factor BamE (lipoprotein component of BamABCDE complex)